MYKVGATNTTGFARVVLIGNAKKKTPIIYYYLMVQENVPIKSSTRSCSRNHKCRVVNRVAVSNKSHIDFI